MKFWAIVSLLVVLILVGVALFGIKVARFLEDEDEKDDDADDSELPAVKWWQYQGSDMVICLADDHEYINQLTSWHKYTFSFKAKTGDQANPRLADYLDRWKSLIESGSYGYLNGNYVYSWTIDKDGFVLTTRMWPDKWRQGKPGCWYYLDFRGDTKFAPKNVALALDAQIPRLMDEKFQKDNLVREGYVSGQTSPTKEPNTL